MNNKKELLFYPIIGFLIIWWLCCIFGIFQSNILSMWAISFLGALSFICPLVCAYLAYCFMRLESQYNLTLVALAVIILSSLVFQAIVGNGYLKGYVGNIVLETFGAYIKAPLMISITIAFFSIGGLIFIYHAPPCLFNLFRKDKYKFKVFLCDLWGHISQQMSENILKTKKIQGVQMGADKSDIEHSNSTQNDIQEKNNTESSESTKILNEQKNKHSLLDSTYKVRNEIIHDFTIVKQKTKKTFKKFSTFFKKGIEELNNSARELQQEYKHIININDEKYTEENHTIKDKENKNNIDTAPASNETKQPDIQEASKEPDKANLLKAQSFVRYDPEPINMPKKNFSISLKDSEYLSIPIAEKLNKPKRDMDFTLQNDVTSLVNPSLNQQHAGRVRLIKKEPKPQQVLEQDNDRVQKEITPPPPPLSYQRIDDSRPKTIIYRTTEENKDQTLVSDNTLLKELEEMNDSEHRDEKQWHYAIKDNMKENMLTLQKDIPDSQEEKEQEHKPLISVAPAPETHFSVEVVGNHGIISENGITESLEIDLSHNKKNHITLSLPKRKQDISPAITQQHESSQTISHHNMYPNYSLSHFQIPYSSYYAPPIQPILKESQDIQIIFKEENTDKKPTEVYSPPKITLEDNMQLNHGYIFPPLDFLQASTGISFDVDEVEIDKKINNLLGKLKLFKIEGDIVNIHTGPIVTTFEYRPAPHVKVSRILNLSDDLAMALQAKTLRIEAPVPGKDVVGIEIPNNQSHLILLRDVLESQAYKTSSSPLTLALGKDIVGNSFVTDLRKLPHLLIAGTTGSGKSVGINSMILSLLYRNTPQTLKFIMIDPKMLEFSVYNDIPHLLTPVITEPKKAISILAATVVEMEKRYNAMSAAQTKNIENYNQKMQLEGKESLPYIVVVIDELADLMMTGGKEVEFHIARLAQMARASGIHLIIATQRPSVDIVTGSIKANLPSRISYKVGQKIDSKVIIDGFGAETLLGRGDMLFTDGTGLKRLHAPWSSEEEIAKVVDFLKLQSAPQYDEDFLKIDDTSSHIGKSTISDTDDLYVQAKQIILSDNKTSASYIQRRLGIGYNRAANIIEELEREGFLSAPNTKGVREILMP